MKKIISIDGGGAQGVITEIEAMVVFENLTGVRIADAFDMIVGTSAGSIIATMVGSGMYPATFLAERVDEVIPKVFKRRFFHKRGDGKYSKEALKKEYSELFGEFACLGGCRCDVAVTSYEDTHALMHFFKSWEEEKDGLLGMFEVVDRSSAAPLFFKPVIDFVRNLVWLDGGVTIFNNPSFFCFVESILRGWHEEKGGVICYSLGCGYVPQTRTFEEATKKGALRGLFNFWQLGKGGLARATVSRVITRALKAITKLSWWEFRRFDLVIDKELEGMDKLEFSNDYKANGAKLGRRLAEQWLKDCEDEKEECLSRR